MTSCIVISVSYRFGKAACSFSFSRANRWNRGILGALLLVYVVVVIVVLGVVRVKGFAVDVEGMMGVSAYFGFGRKETVIRDYWGFVCRLDLVRSFI